MVSCMKTQRTTASMYAISDMMRISLAQYVIVFLVTVVSAFFVGQDAAYTALMAGLAYAVPTTLLALFLVLPKFLTAYSPSAVAVLGGEFVFRYLASFGADGRVLRKPSLARLYLHDNCGGEQLLHRAVQETLRIGIHGSRSPYRY